MKSNHLSHSTPDSDASLLDWLNYMQGIHVSAIDMGLSRVLPVAKKLDIINAGNNSYVFTVAGTNGKGSTTAVIAEICQQAGYKTALYQSPHLIDFNERVRINGVSVDDKTLINAFVQVEQARIACDISLSFFEMTTLAAMLIFAESECDVWVLEIGLGGRLDVVNIIDPDMTVITNIGVDHIDWLGDDREKIGYEKAGILRKGVPLVFGDNDMPDSVQQKINDLAVPCYQAGRDFYHTQPNVKNNVEKHTNSAENSAESMENEVTIGNIDTWQYSHASLSKQLPTPNISLVNTANAISAVQSSNLSISYEAIYNAMNNAKLAGRFDYREQRGRRWLFDVAHNEEGVKFLLNQLNAQTFQLLPESQTKAKIHLVFSMLKDKDIDTVVELLETTLPIERWHVAAIDPTYNPRSADTNSLLDVISQHVDEARINRYESLSKATHQAITSSNEQDLILVCGSFHTISEVITVVGE